MAALAGRGAPCADREARLPVQVAVCSSPARALCGSSVLSPVTAHSGAAGSAQGSEGAPAAQPCHSEQAVTTTASPGPALTGPAAGRCQSPAAAARAHLGNIPLRGKININYILFVASNNFNVRNSKSSRSVEPTLDCSTLLINANFLRGCLTLALSVAHTVQEIEVLCWGGHCSLGCGAHAPKNLSMPSRGGV
ncbi:hypothetical protein EK904_010355 [Melospiza melodia maxima]|nr:hypothetical protein EK904_010355 [Melospiza melodia maxima]